MAQDRQLWKWQRRMASFMTASIILAAAFFAVVTLWQYGRFQARLAKPVVAVEDVWSIALTSDEQQFELAKTRAAFALERDLIARRYDQANLALTTRLWTRLMGFVTGMILALVGAAFVLGKLSEDVTEAAAKAGLPGHEWSFSVRSASPGVILAVLGTVLMALSISIQGSYSTEDRAVYFGRVASTSSVLRPGEAEGPADPPSLADSIKPPKQPCAEKVTP